MILYTYDFCLNRYLPPQSNCFQTSLHKMSRLHTEFSRIHTFFHLKTILHKVSHHGILLSPSRFSFLQTIILCIRSEDLLILRLHSQMVHPYPTIHHKTNLPHQHIAPYHFSCCPSTILHNMIHRGKGESHTHFFHIEKLQHLQ